MVAVFAMSRNAGAHLFPSPRSELLLKSSILFPTILIGAGLFRIGIVEVQVSTAEAVGVIAVGVIAVTVQSHPAHLARLEPAHLIPLSVGIEHAGHWVRKLHTLTLAGAVGTPRPERFQVPSIIVHAMVAEQACWTGPGVAINLHISNRSLWSVIDDHH
jgi:hypothetical protein